MMSEDRRARFPLGSQVRLEALSSDPYPLLTALQEREPVSWVEELQAWFVTRRADFLSVLLDSATFSVASPASLLQDTVGQTMLSTDGTRQRHLRQPFNAPFTPKEVQAHMAAPIAAYVSHLIDAFAPKGQADLKSAFADPLPLWTVMTVLGLPIYDFSTVRGWFTDIAHALGNFARDQHVRERGRVAASAFGEYAASHLARLRREPDGSILAAVASSGALSDEEILSAARVIVFGGLETTSAMLANTCGPCSVTRLNTRQCGPTRPCCHRPSRRRCAGSHPYRAAHALGPTRWTCRASGSPRARWSNGCGGRL